MAKRKLQRFAENATFDHFFQPSFDELREGFPLKSNWAKDFFGNTNDIIIELGCGKGEYTVALAQKHPDRNYIGIDKKGARMWRGGKTSQEQQLKNVAFIRTRSEMIELLFGKNEISEIWITFPEPQPNKFKRRFTSPEYIERYRNLLKPDGIIHLKTDNADLFNYSLGVISKDNHRLLYSTADLYHTEMNKDIEEVLPVQTFYEQMWLEKGLNIHYLKFQMSLKNENG